MATASWIPRVKPFVFLACLIPALLLGWDAFTGGLGVNPIEDITHRTGDWALRFLLVTLAVTPLRWLAGWNGLVRFRRMLGLFAFFYAVLHFSTYLVFDHFFDLLLIIDDVAERRYVTAGFVGFVLMIPLAVTSTQGWIRRLGRRWAVLHRLVYASAVAGVVHFLWLVKIDIGEPLIYAVILAILLGARLAHRYRGHGGAVRTGATGATRSAAS
ncbi:MAG: sulfoxide reductase heme-binding subunit YedZ [Acidobacteria bacterium]|nr:sulfoxide reductase heme-binding subunit YedZ [Acidobacteriota bacterium]MYH31394.1 sulfoxide reductase heme-binding subunit YedZ [Acidobacteriota bacterium]MYK86887.1 sulfoxide reductase heme-binding subunit YedZ [Acidobacteriota bacterium]